MTTKYSKSVIYKIVCNDAHIEDCYIGSTTNMNRRKLQHKKSCYNRVKKSYHRRLYVFMRLYGGFDNFEFIELEKCVCNNKHELLQKEQKYIEELQPSLNCNRSLKSDD